MSLYDAARILKTRYFQIAHLRQGRGNRSRHVIGFDSESERGAPFMFQFSEHGDESAVEIVDLPPKVIPLDVFMTWVHDHCSGKETEYLIFGWNLQYEWTQLFATLPPDVFSMDEYGVVYTLRAADGTDVARYNIHVFNAKRYAATFTRLGLKCIEKCTPDNHKCGSKRRVRLLDGMAYYVTSLDKAGEMLGIGRKLAKPERFGREQAMLPYFRDYARQDAYLTRRIGEQIVAMHDEFDVEQTISAPHFASSVFKRHFLRDRIALPSIDLEQAGLYSYHGGKNGDYLKQPMHLSNVWSFDITSAYPEAMRALPDPELATWEFYDSYKPHRHALWRISGQYKSCKWRGIMQHGNGFAETGYLDGIWTTGYELDAAIAHGEITLASCVGYVMKGPRGGALTEYVDKFFDMKRTTTGAARAAAKLFLNSLYGKFFQKTPLGTVGYYEIGDETVYVTTNPEQEYDWQAGGLYHPPIASLITGFVRAKIHRLEHKYDALMTSTDGFFARKAPDPDDVGTNLGDLTAERGDLTIWRERLYCFQPASGKTPKFALHGFRGTLDDLRKIPLVAGLYTYTAQQMVTLKLSLHSHGKRRQRFAPGEFATLEYTLDITAASGP